MNWPSKSPTLRLLGHGVLVGSGVYVLSYVVLSLFGTYAPAAYGIKGVKWYEWAPAGFYSYPPSGGWTDGILYKVYLPLHILDNRFWHNRRFPLDHERQHPPAIIIRSKKP